MSSQPRALVVEDDRSWQSILEELLGDAGLAVDLADNLAAARALISAQTHRLAVVDLSLSGKDHNNQDGLRVLDELRLRDPGCAAVLLTGFATVELAVSVLTDYGALTVLQKENFQRSRFRQTVQKALSAPPEGQETAAPLPVQPEEQGEGRALSGGRALVVEDDAGWRGILNELLADAGFQVRLCAGFGEALGCLRRERYNLAVMDLSLGGDRPRSGSAAGGDLEGYRLLAASRSENIPTIVVSGVAAPAEIERIYSEGGVFAYMEKQSFDRRAFLKTVEEAVSSSQPPDELAGLTDRERDVLKLLTNGMTNKEIGETLFISPNTVKRHVKAIYRKLDIHTRSAAVVRVLAAADEPERGED